MNENCYYNITKIHEQQLLSIAEIKTYLRINSSNFHNEVENTILNTITIAAISYAEKFLRVNLIEKNVCYIIVKVKSLKILLPIVPAKKIISVKNLSNNSIIDQQFYQLSCNSTNIQFLSNDFINQSVKIEYTVSTIDPSIINAIKPGILLHISELYDRRIIEPKVFASINQIYQSYKKVLI
ncbi:hypothetical protein ACA351_05850 [Orientia tsutsugamushi]|uniref:hypothetical protein n=1 Tax=Orientia tsutsugamushi TaxID=784 RepID=UPI003527E226